MTTLPRCDKVIRLKGFNNDIMWMYGGHIGGHKMISMTYDVILATAYFAS